jgi:peroxiredoxin
MQPGATLQPFSLKGIDGKIHEVNTLDQKAGLLILFVCNHCPYVHRYASRIKHLVDTYSQQGVEIYAINSNDAERYPEDAFERMPEMGKRLGLESQYLYDENQEIAREFRAERTPEAFLFNSAGVLVYRGAIDNNHRDESQVTERYLYDALYAVVNNDQIQINYLPPVGCSIKWKLP